MKKIFTILLLGCACLAHATNYYISWSTGNDGNNGLSAGAAWKTLAKVNTFFPSLAPGDSVLFNRGDSWYGTLTIGKSGVAGNRIIISAYGTGARPLITGFTTIVSWTNEGNGIYSSTISSAQLTNMVLVNGLQKAMGREPDNSYYTYQSASTNKSITSSALTGTPNWTGAEAVIRASDWLLNRTVINSQSGSTLNYTSKGDTSYNSIPGFGFFIQNDIRTLTTFGEWYHDPTAGKLYMYFGGGGPGSNVVNVATINALVSNIARNYDYVVWDGIDLKGCITNGFDFNYNTIGWTFQNSNISYCGNTGLTILTYSTNDTIQRCNFSWCNRTSINENPATGLVIQYDTITNIGTIPGQVLGAGGYEGLYSASDAVQIRHNVIKNCGYNGITLKYNGSAILQYNKIDSVCLVLDDGGGIYLNHVNAATRIIDHNIISNVIGNLSGSSHTKSPSAGMYLDEFASNVQVTNNTISNVLNGVGIKDHKGSNDRIDSNIVYNCSVAIYFEDEVGNSIRNLSMNRNIFCAMDSTQLCLQWYTVSNDIPSFGKASSNVYLRPLKDLKTFKLQPKGNTANTTLTQSLAEWQLYSGKDSGSSRSPKVLTNVNQFLFSSNPTDTLQLIKFLGFKKIDPDGVVYSHQATAERYSSKILMDSGLIANLPPVARIAPVADITLPTSQVTLTSNSSDTDGVIKSYKWSIVTGDGNIVSSTLISSVMNGLTAGVHQVKLVVTDSLGAKDSAIVTFTVHLAIQPNKPPVITLGPDTTITLPLDSLTVTLTASDSDGTVVKTKIYKISGPLSGSITYDTATTTTMTALVQGQYIFGGYAVDNTGDTSRTTKKVTVNAAPVNIPPVADAGADTTLVLPTNSVTLFGKGTDVDGTIPGYQWKEGATVLGTTATITITGITQGVHTYTLTVTDNIGASNSKDVHVTVNAAPVPSARVLIFGIKAGE